MVAKMCVDSQYLDEWNFKNKDHKIRLEMLPYIPLTLFAVSTQM